MFDNKFMLNAHIYDKIISTRYILMLTLKLYQHVTY